MAVKRTKRERKTLLLQPRPLYPSHSLEVNYFESYLNLFSSPSPDIVILTKSDYYTRPPLHELASFVNESGQCVVDDFTVGRRGYGEVMFIGKTDITGLNLDELGM